MCEDIDKEREMPTKEIQYDERHYKLQIVDNLGSVITVSVRVLLSDLSGSESC